MWNTKLKYQPKEDKWPNQSILFVKQNWLWEITKNKNKNWITRNITQSRCEKCFHLKIVTAVRPLKYYDGRTGSKIQRRAGSQPSLLLLIKPMFVVLQVLFIESHARAVPKLAKPTRLIDPTGNDTLFNLILLWATVSKPQPYAFIFVHIYCQTIFRNLQNLR